MKIVIAIDSFKGSLSSLEAAEAAREGILRVYPKSEIYVKPLADGGEGTTEAIVLGAGGRLVSCEVTSPSGKRITAEYGVIDGGRIAVIEMAAAAGITLVSGEERNPLNTTTYGVGELIRHAIEVTGAREFIIGLGGSATNDGGIGMLTALGYEFLDGEGLPVSVYGRGLRDIKKIETGGALPQLSECRFRIASDVTNPLCGKRGASRIYGPQKGADEKTVENMDGWLHKFARLTEKTLGSSFAEYPGAGAAGGLGFAFLSYLSGELSSGIELVSEAVGLPELLAGAEICVTGEGRLDGQSANGKAPIGVARLAKRHGATVIALSGAVATDAGKNNSEGIDAFFPITRAPITLTEAMDKDNARRNMTDTTEQVFRLYKAAKGQ